MFAAVAGQPPAPRAARMRDCRTWGASDGSWPEIIRPIGALFRQPLGIAAALGFAAITAGAIGFHAKSGDYSDPKTRGSSMAPVGDPDQFVPCQPSTGDFSVPAGDLLGVASAWMGEEVVGAVVAIQVAVDHHGSGATFCRHPEQRPAFRIEEDLRQDIGIGAVLTEPFRNPDARPPAPQITKR
ncbi:hypothetical protein PUR57_12435 [Streptomyces sp. JV176]|uniref:hypothetical protein n=1 Tax=Streptomyces sp. JV176 TaxID=858630 RepID=UPI002E784D58|nr:hypothetical protein [Streptomyces sp. JV176]MEE1799472.1 hypothetical protein [Streptomyces sp. JV176]